MPGPTKHYNGIDVVQQRIQNVADPSVGTDAATKQYVDNASAGLAWKQSVRVATTANGALATAFANGQSIDGVTLATGNRILIKNQTTGTENGIYTVNASGAPTRATDADTAAELRSATVFVEEGSTQSDTAWNQTADNITIGTTALTFVRFGAGQAYTGSNGVAVTGNNITAVAGDSTVTVDSAGIKVTPGAFPKKFTQDVPALTAGTATTITHGLNTLDIVAMVVLKSGGDVVDLGICVTGVNTVTVQSATAQSSGLFRFTAVG